MNPDAGPPRPIPWRDIFEELSERKGWTYDQIAGMSLSQIVNAIHQGKPPGEAPGRTALVPGEVPIHSDEHLDRLIRERRQAGLIK